MVSRVSYRVPLSVGPLALALWCLSAIVWADTKVIIAEGTYTMGDGETPTVAESLALHTAKRMAVEQAGTYLESYAKIKNFQLTTDEVQTISGALIEVEVLDKKRTVVGEGFHFYVKIKATVTTDKVEELVARLKRKTTEPTTDLVKQYKELQDNYDRVTKEIDILKKKLGKATSKQEKEQTVAEIANLERRYLAEKFDEEGLSSGFMKGDSAKAREYFSQAISQDPTYATAYFHRALFTESLEQALADYTEAIKLDPHPAYYSGRGKIYLKLGQKERALADLSTAVRVGQNTVDDHYSYYSRGEAYKELGQYELAIADFTEIMRVLPPDDSLRARALGERASAFTELGKYQEAIDDYSELIRHDPDSPALYALRASMYSLLGKHKFAFEDLTEAIRLEPNEEELARLRPSLRSLRAMEAFSLGLMEQVIIDATEAIRGNPTDFDALALAYWLRGKAKNTLGQFEEAIADLAEAIRLKPNHARLYTTRASAYVLLNRYELAIADLTVAIRLGPDKDEASATYGLRGWLYAKLGKYEQALSDYTESIKIDPKKAESYRARGLIYGSLGKSRRAESDLNKACELGEGEACDLLDRLQ